MTKQLLCKVSELPAPGKIFKVSLSQDAFCVANSDGTISVLGDPCVHDRRSSLSRGTLRDGKVLCPRHGWAFDLATGEVPHIPGCGARVYPVEIEGSDVNIVTTEIGSQD
jgi:nitrite reductase/ring-hydroxylating ferredoxin subunit